jgi:hypothetical protein
MHSTVPSSGLRQGPIRPYLAILASEEQKQRSSAYTFRRFGLLLNWNLLGSGPHTLRALADEVEIGRAEVSVVTLTGEFVRDVQGSV